MARYNYWRDRRRYAARASSKLHTEAGGMLMLKCTTTHVPGPIGGMYCLVVIYHVFVDVVAFVVLVLAPCLF